MSKFHRHRVHINSQVDPGDDDPLPSGERGHLILATVNGIGRRPLPIRREGAEDALNFLADHPEMFGPVENIENSDATPRQRDAALCLELARIKAVSPPPRTTALDRRIDWLGHLTGLTALDRAIAALAVRRRLWPLWASMCERALYQSGGWLKAGLIGAMLGATAHAVRQRLQRYSPLMQAGLIEDHQDDDFSASDFLLRLGKIRSTDPDHLAAAMLQPERPSALDWDDFVHFRADRDVAASLLAAAARRRDGINLLLHGTPGTGKTEFARALADRLGLQAIFVGKADSEGGDPKRSERIAHLTVVRALTRRSRKHLIVVDEAEDLMLVPEGRERSLGSKLWLNHLIERSAGPTIWIANDLEALGAPVIRRMSAAIGFRLPPPTVRERIIARHAEGSGLHLTEADRRRLGKLCVPPAVTAHAVRAASLTDGTTATIQRVAAGLGEALRAPLTPPWVEPAPFDPVLSRADLDLEFLAGRLAASADRAWSMLLEGVSGTGKSAYARHLAERLGLELVEKRGSDLLGPYVGETEGRIALAFSEAAERGALLLLDEADALLRDRRGAERGWEVSMTNEMLSWMERHPAPFIVTTNLAETLDPATMRRFLFRIRFETLDPPRADLLWVRHFGDPAPRALAGTSGLTPSDFAIVARRIALCGEVSSVNRLSMLRAEAAARPFASAKMGFMAGSELWNEPTPSLM